MIRLALMAIVTLFAAPMASAQAAGQESGASANATSASLGTLSKTRTAVSSGQTPGDRMICEHQEITGSRLQGRKVCKTASQWEAERQEARDAVTRAQTVRGCNIGGGC